MTGIQAPAFYRKIIFFHNTNTPVDWLASGALAAISMVRIYYALAKNGVVNDRSVGETSKHPGYTAKNIFKNKKKNYYVVKCVACSRLSMVKIYLHLYSN